MCLLKRTYGVELIPGAFSGLLSYGLFQVENSLHGWQLLFLIEGGLTVVCAVMA